MHAEQINALASDWLAREQNGLAPQEQAALDAWLAESPQHMVAYLRLKSAWDRAGRLAVLRAPMRQAASRKSAGVLLRLSAAAVVVLALGYAGKSYLQPPAPHVAAQPAQVFVTKVGETRGYRLADGSRIELNTDTRVRADLSGGKRTITLESGEAFFQVAHDASHPFVVNAGKRRITDIGTKFSVFLNDETVRVLVSEGRVRVETQPGVAGPAPVTADAGHVVIAQGMEALVFAKPGDDVARDLSWRDGMLTFDQQPLTEVAKEFNRYNARHIQVEGKARKIRIGGSFKADNVDAFVVLLQQGFGLSVKNQGDKIVVSR